MMGFRHLSIGRKLGVSFGIIGLLVVVLGGVSGYLLQRLNAHVEYITSYVEPSLLNILRMDVIVSDFRQIQPSFRTCLKHYQSLDSDRLL